MLSFFAANHCSNIKKSTVFGEYLDPLAIVEEFKLTLYEKSIVVKSKHKPIDAGPYPGFARIVDIPVELLVDGVNDKVDIATFIYFNLMCSVDKAHSIAAAGLSDVMPFVNQYYESVSSGSFYPEILDLYNIWSGLCAYEPEVVVEIGGGVSTSLISYYCSNRNVKHILIDPEEYWVQNTFSGLKACGLKPPAYEPLPVVEKDTNIAVGLDFAKTSFNRNTYYDFDYNNNHLLLDSLSTSSKKLFFVDANCKKGFFQGAELFIDPVVSQMLSDSLILVDWRLRACTLLSLIQNIKKVYSTNTNITFDNIGSVGRLINYGFTAFAYQ